MASAPVTLPFAHTLNDTTHCIGSVHPVSARMFVGQTRQTIRRGSPLPRQKNRDLPQSASIPTMQAPLAAVCLKQSMWVPWGDGFIAHPADPAGVFRADQKIDFGSPVNAMLPGTRHVRCLLSDAEWVRLAEHRSSPVCAKTTRHIQIEYTLDQLMAFSPNPETESFPARFLPSKRQCKRFCIQPWKRRLASRVFRCCGDPFVRV